MHGLINRSIQCFLRDTYGEEAWAIVARETKTDQAGFEAMLDYDDAITMRLLRAISVHLNKPSETVLEDVGTYLVTHPNTHAIRRLLRFGGDCYEEFLSSLDDLPNRAWLAVPDLEFPLLELRDHEAGHYSLQVTHVQTGFAHVMVGIMRALADDYGALVTIEVDSAMGDVTLIDIRLADLTFAEGNAFSLGAKQTAGGAI